MAATNCAILEELGDFGIEISPTFPTLARAASKPVEACWRNRFAIASLCAITAALVSITAAAQSAMDQDVGLNEIVVTAQRKEQRLRDVPVSASVVGALQLQSEGIRTLEDLTARLPNVRIAQVPGGDSINVRGVGSGSNLGFEQSVATFVDGVYRSRARSSRLGLFDIERVEVLRGPQTTFFGNNAIAGALNITTRRPGRAFEYNASALYSPSDDEYSVEAGITIPLNDQLSVRLAGRQSGMGGYIRNTADDSHGPNLNNKIGRISVRWQPSETISVDARLDVGRMRDKSIYNSELLFCPPDAAFGGPRGACARYLTMNGGTVDDRLNHRTFTGPSFLDYDFTEASVRTAVDLGGHRLTAISSFFDHDFDQISNVVPTDRGSVTPGINFGLSTRSTESLKQYSQEVRFESTEDRTISYMFGAYYLHADLSTETRAGFWFARNFAYYIPNTQNDDLFSLFAASTVTFTPRLRLNLGLRYSLVDKHSTRAALGGTADYLLTNSGFNRITGPAEAALLTAFGVDLPDYPQPNRSDKKLMPSVNLQYAFNERVMGYASYAKGFKAGGNAQGASNASFIPETVDAYEIGLKSSFLDNAVTLNIAAFLSKYDDLQEATFVILANGTPKGSIANVATSKAKGIEVGGSIRPIRGLQLNFDLAYLSSKYTSYLIAPCTALGTFLNPTCVQDLSGEDRAFAPKWSGNVGLSYRQPIGGNLEANFDTSLFFTSRYFQQSTSDPLSVQRRFAKIDARLGIGPNDRRWEIAVIGKNLTDRTTAGYRSQVPSSPGSYQALTDRPRSVALQLSVRN